MCSDKKYSWLVYWNEMFGTSSVNNMPILFELIQNKIFVLNLFMEKIVKIEFSLQEK